MQNVWLYNYNNYNTVAHHAIHTYINCTVAMYVCSRAAQDMMKCTVLISESWYEQLTQQQDSTAISAPWLSSCTESRLLIDQCRPISRSSFLCTCCFQYMRIYVHSYCTRTEGNWSFLPSLDICGSFECALHKMKLLCHLLLAVTLQLTALSTSYGDQGKLKGLGLDLPMID